MKICHHSIDAHFYEVVTILSQVFLGLLGATTSIEGKYCCTAIWLSTMYDQQSLIRHWHLFLGGSDILCTILARKDQVNIYYELMPWLSHGMIQEEKWNIIYAPLT